MISVLFLYLVAAVFCAIGLFWHNAGKTAEVRHHHTLGHGLGCGWVFFVVGILAAWLATFGAFGGGR